MKEKISNEKLKLEFSNEVKTLYYHYHNLILSKLQYWLEGNDEDFNLIDEKIDLIGTYLMKYIETLLKKELLAKQTQSARGGTN